MEFLCMLNSKLFQKLRSLFNRYYYKGNRFYCPCCESHCREFKTHGRLNRINARCPMCSSLERHRLMFEYLKQKTPFFQDDLRVLHFAPELFLSKIFSKCKNLQYVTTDLASPVAMIHMDITDNIFKDHTFDVIICYHVLEHIPDDLKAMQECLRVLKPGGWGIFQVPLDLDRENTYEDASITSPEGRLEHFGQVDHVRKYGWSDYQKRLEEAGFEVTVDDFIEQLGPKESERLSVNVAEKIYYCQKPL